MQNRPAARRHANPATEAAAQRTAIANALIVAVSSLNLAVYFFMVSSEPLLHVLVSTGQYIIFPLAAVTSVLYAVTAWRTAMLHKHRKHLVVRAIAETIGAAAIIAAVTLTMVLGVGTSIVGPIVFASFLGAKTLYQLGSAIYFGIKTAITADPAKKAEYRDRTKYAIYSTIAGALTTAAVIAVDIFFKPSVAIIGILAASFAAAYSILKVVDIRLKAKARADMQAAAIEDEIEMKQLGKENSLTTTAQLALAMPPQPDNSHDSATESADERPVDEYGFNMVEIVDTSYASEQLRTADRSRDVHTTSEVASKDDEFYTITL